LNQTLHQVFKDAQKALEKDLAQTSLSQLLKKTAKKDKH
jgi:DNA-binding IscR family transcriptional regulator